MTYTEHKITLDIHKTVSQESLCVKKGDTGRKLIINLTERGYPYHISDDCYAVFTAKKPDGHIVFNECKIDGCMIIYDFTDQTAVVAGQLDCEIKLYGADSELITSPSFTIIVKDTVYDEGDVVESTDEFSALTELIAEAQALKIELQTQITEAEALKSEIEVLNEELQEALENATELDATLTEEGKAADAKATGDAINKLKEQTQEAVTSLQGGITTVANNLNTRASAIEQDIADLKYVEIEITSISNDVGTVEMGTTVETVTVSWKLNKEPASQKVNGEEVDTALRSKTLTGLKITTGTAFSVTVTDERGATDLGKTNVKFLNGVYYGALRYGGAVDNDAVLGLLTRKLQSNNTLDFTVTPGEGKRPAYACPTRYGTPTFKIGGFAYDWEKVTTFDFTNASGYTESYDVWMHGQDVTDTITVSVS